MFRVSRRQLGARRLDVMPEVVGDVPLQRADLGEEALHVGFVVEELAVQMPWVPVDQDPAEVEDDGVDRSHLLSISGQYVRLEMACPWVAVSG